MTIRRTRLVSGAIALVAAVACVRPAGAQTPDQDAVFRRGLALYDASDYAGAIATWETLRESIGEQRAWKLLYNLGLAYQALGDATHAIERFEAFVRLAAEHDDAQTSPELRARVEDARGRVHALETANGAIAVRAPASGSAVMTRVGTGGVRPAGYTVWLSPGPHEVEVGTGTARVHVVKVNVTAGATVEVTTDDVAPSPSAPASTATTAPPVAPPPPVHEGGHFPTAWVVLGAGVTVASAALPIALGLRASSQRQNADQLGAGNTAYSSALGDYQNARTLYYASYAVPGLLAAVTATIAVAGLLGSSGREGGAEVHASIDPTGSALWIGGRF